MPEMIRGRSLMILSSLVDFYPVICPRVSGEALRIRGLVCELLLVLRPLPIIDGESKFEHWHFFA